MTTACVNLCSGSLTPRWRRWSDYQRDRYNDRGECRECSAVVLFAREELSEPNGKRVLIVHERWNPDE